MAGLVENCNRYQRSGCVTAGGADNDVTLAFSPSTAPSLDANAGIGSAAKRAT
jgi:hypothetical protein